MACCCASGEAFGTDFAEDPVGTCWEVEIGCYGAQGAGQAAGTVHTASYVGVRVSRAVDPKVEGVVVTTLQAAEVACVGLFWILLISFWLYCNSVWSRH